MSAAITTMSHGIRFLVAATAASSFVWAFFACEFVDIGLYIGRDFGITA